MPKYLDETGLSHLWDKIKAYVTAHSGGGGTDLPAGTIQMYGGSTIPDGWLLCDGSFYMPSEYPELYAAIGQTWGYNDVTGFAVPDLQGRAPIGAGHGSGLSNRALGGNVGAETHTLTTAQIPAHSHPLGHYVAGIASSSWAGETYSGSLSGSGYKVMQFASSVNWTSKNATSNNTGGGGAHNNMQPSAVVNFIIYTGQSS